MKGNRGFTLIELLITVAIIGVLATASVTAYIGSIRSAARSEAYTNLQNLRMLEEQVFADTGNYALLGALARWRPGPSTSFTYVVTIANGVGLPTPVPVPYNGATANLPLPTTPCFIARATGNANTRVTGDIFAIDCNNNRNFD
ncbi:MAG: fimbrial protein [Nitrospirae bacterium]|nr:fimbrial protein [Nitrospirota bacterium]